MSRHSHIERVGVYKSGFVVEKDLKWIFREQTVADVGVDATIELAEDGEPLGKKFNAQIKSGAKVVHESKKYYTLYVSNVHHDYWLKLDNPIIAIYYNPDLDELFWAPLNSSTLKRTKQRYKVDISKSSMLNSKAKKHLFTLVNEEELIVVSEPDNSGDYQTTDSVSLQESLKAGEIITETTKSVRRMVGSMNEFTVRSQPINEELKAQVDKGRSDTSPEIKRIVLKWANNLTTLNSELSEEIPIFSENITQGVLSFWKLYQMLSELYTELESQIESQEDFELLREGEDSLSYAKLSVESVLNSFEDVIPELTKLQMKVKAQPRRYPKIRAARNSLDDTLSCIIQEFVDAKSLTEEFLNAIEQIDQERSLTV